MAELSYRSGGCIKFDLKAWHPEVNLALCGVSNRQTLENFRRLISWTFKRPQPPLLIASTLLVPGYIDLKEIAGIAGFIASLNPEIPYTLLAFYPTFYLDDLPTTSRSFALQGKELAQKAGLRQVKIANIHLLRDD